MTKAPFNSILGDFRTFRRSKRVKSVKKKSKIPLIYSNKNKSSISYEQFRQANIGKIERGGRFNQGRWSNFVNSAKRGGGCGSCSGVR